MLIYVYTLCKTVILFILFSVTAVAEEVIVHGDAYKFFMKDLSHTPYQKEKNLLKAKDSLGKRLNTLAKQYNVVFLVCKIGTINRKLDKKAFYHFVSFVQSAPVGLIDAQNKGFAYLPLH